MKLSRVRVIFQIVLHLALIGHVLAYYLAGWTVVGGLDFQDFFHNWLGEGVITAAVLFAGTIYLLSLVWGRLFCSWGCHFGAAQDLFAWVLRKLGWTAPLVKTRFLHWTPYLLLIGLFLWPSVANWIDSGWEYRGAGPGGPLSGAGPWERLPGWFLSITTLVVCGAVVLLFLGTRGFCRFVCPYGAVFRITDRVAPFRVRRTGSCTASCSEETVAPCTSVCPTAIDVHRETAEHGKVTAVDCVRCNLCIEACPSTALSYSATTTTATATREPTPRTETPRIATPRIATPKTVTPKTVTPKTVTRFSFAAWEEGLILAIASIAFLICDSVYGGHFLAATLAFGEGFVVLLLVRLVKDADVRLAGITLRRSKRWRFAGILLFAIGVATVAPLYHAASYKVHRHFGMSVFALQKIDGVSQGHRALELDVRDEKRIADAAEHLRRALDRFPSDLDSRRALCEIYVETLDERAIDVAEEITRRTGESLASLENLRRVYLKFGRIGRALWVAERVAKKASESEKETKE
jgi:polyferredoxin